MNPPSSELTRRRQSSRSRSVSRSRCSRTVVPRLRCVVARSPCRLSSVIDDPARCRLAISSNLSTTLDVKKMPSPVCRAGVGRQLSLAQFLDRGESIGQTQILLTASRTPRSRRRRSVTIAIAGASHSTDTETLCRGMVDRVVHHLGEGVGQKPLGGRCSRRRRPFLGSHATRPLRPSASSVVARGEDHARGQR